MLEWVIVGGGVHGVHLAAVLLGSCGVSAERVRIVDPHPRLLQRWLECTAATGMRYLRSPGVHHLDLEAWSLLRYGGVRGAGRRLGGFSAPYERPALRLFNHHAQEVIARHGLEALHVQARVEGARLEEGGVVLETGAGELASRRVLLAMGVGEQLRWPEWAAPLRSGGRVRHLFEAGLDVEAATSGWEQVAVVGGGISAAQVALRLGRPERPALIVSPHPVRVHRFDSDPGWLGPRNMEGFARTGCMVKRRELIQAARHAGSLPDELVSELRRAERRGAVEWVEASIAAVRPCGGLLEVVAEGGAALPLVDGVLLATGFEPRRPGGAWLDRLVESAGLPCAPCGYPVVDEGLRWHPQVVVAGALAELELGPVARNIAGARRAGERLTTWVRAAG